MPMALVLICCAHLFTFSEVRVKERRRRKDTAQTAASAACNAHFETQLTCATFSRSGCLACVFSASPLSVTHASENVNKAPARLCLSALNVFWTHTYNCISQQMRANAFGANAIGIHARYAPCVSRVYASNFLLSPSAQS